MGLKPTLVAHSPPDMSTDHKNTSEHQNVAVDPYGPPSKPDSQATVDHYPDRKADYDAYLQNSTTHLNDLDGVPAATKLPVDSGKNSAAVTMSQIGLLQNIHVRAHMELRFHPRNIPCFHYALQTSHWCDGRHLTTIMWLPRRMRKKHSRWMYCRDMRHRTVWADIFLSIKHLLPMPIFCLPM